MPTDMLGNPVSTLSAATRRAIDDFVEGMLSYETRAQAIVDAADADPASCLANVYAGLLCMFLEAPDAALRAAKYLLAAERAASTATVRERLNLDLLRTWMADDMRGAFGLCERLSSDFPRDLLVVKIHQYFEFNRGNAPEMLRAVLKVIDRNADIPYVHGMAAFAYEQCHLLDQAEAAARTALALRRKEPWAQHALAHVLLTRGRIDDGAVFLEDHRDTWTGLNSFMLTHLWWHLGLFYLSQGRRAQVLELYDHHCWAVAPDYSQDQVGAVSLLARMELAGIEVGERWQAVGDYLVARADDSVLPFLSMQYLYGLARAGRPQAQTLLAAVRRAAHDAAEPAREVWRDVALPACESLLAYARGEFDAAWRGLNAVLPRLAEAGGSHAQRDLFEQLVLDAAIKSGRWPLAQQVLEQRRRHDPDGVPLNTALAKVYGKLGLPILAQQASERALRTVARHR